MIFRIESTVSGQASVGIDDLGLSSFVELLVLKVHGSAQLLVKGHIRALHALGGFASLRCECIIKDSFRL